MIVLPPGKFTHPDPELFGNEGYRKIHEYNPEDKCFFCHKYLCGPATILWAGRSDIYLHLECALSLIVGLAHDVAEAKKYGVRLEMRTEPKQYRTPLPRV